jgi:YVTN family beta-propeller protein
MFRVLVGCALVASCVACGGSGQPHGSDDGAKPVRIKVGQMPCGVVVADGKVWVTNYGDDTLQSIDPKTNRASAPIKVGDQPCGVASGAGSIWVENFGSNDVTRVDAATGQPQATVKVGGQPYDVAFSEGAAWVTEWADGTVSRIDATTNKRTVVSTGGSPTGIAPSAGKLWVPLGGTGVVGIDAASGKVATRLTMPSTAAWTAYTDTAVWVSLRDAHEVVRIDTTTGKVAATMKVGGTPQDAAVLGDAVWVPTREGSVFRIGATDDTVSGPWPTGVGNPFVLSAADGTLWLPDYAGSKVTRIEASSLH